MIYEIIGILFLFIAVVGFFTGFEKIGKTLFLLLLLSGGFTFMGFFLKCGMTIFEYLNK